MKRTLLLSFSIIAVSASAQVNYTGGTYNQNFDTLSLAGVGLTWNDNLPTASMPGWYSNQTTYTADDGTLVGSGQYSFGSGNSAERALGSQALPGAIIVYGLRLNNATTSTYGNLNVAYTGEQWRSGAALTDVLNFEYSTNATSLFTGTWTSFSALSFNSPNNTGAGVLNGNLAANQTALSSTIGSLTWAPSSEMWIRWVHIGGAARHDLGIDNVAISATTVPEPCSLAALGVAGLGLLRRRFKKTA